MFIRVLLLDLEFLKRARAFTSVYTCFTFGEEFN